ncbi:MAG TPA: putative ABC exporter domain-containing protein [Gemmatimonadales bacterium]|nr:putative ABC exporter domain-containing protein [Gemmatimonadales bacterium]
MIRVFWYLTARTVRNRVARELRHLRSPRYVIAFLLGGGYVSLVLFPPGATGAAPRAPNAEWVELVGAVALAGVVAWGWVFGRERRVLTFAPAEVQFLFPAPITRRELIRYKLLRAQLVILFNSVLWTVILVRERIGVSPWLRAVSLWVLLSTLQLHRLGAAFVRTSLAEHGMAGARHRIVSLLAVGTGVAALALSVADALPALAAAWARDIGAVFRTAGEIAERPLPAALLFPFRLMIRPLAAGTLAVWLQAIGPAALLLALHYVWVIRSDTAFEEAAAEASLRRVRSIEARPASGPPGGSRRRVSAPLFTLPPTGWPELAITWKNLVAVMRLRRVANALIVFGAAAGIVGVVSFRPESTVGEIIGLLAAMWAGFLLLVGPQWIRNDLRGDLRKLDLLRSYPLTGAAVIRAEVAASTIVLSVAQLALLLLAYLATLGHPTFDLTLPQRTAMLAAAIAVLPAVNLLALLVQNAGALLFPTWVHLGSGRPGGIEALGQNVLTMLATAALLVMLLVAPAILAAGAVLLLRPALGLWALAPGIGCGLAGIAVEAALLIDWLGRVFDRTDPSATGLEMA